MIPEMNISRKAMEWLIYFSSVNLMLGCFYLKNLKNVMNLVGCQKISFLKLRNKGKIIFARVIIRNYMSKKITRKTAKIISKNTYGWNNRTKFRKWITRSEFVHFKSTINTSRRRTRRIEFIIFSFIKKFVLFQLA